MRKFAYWEKIKAIEVTEKRTVSSIKIIVMINRYVKYIGHSTSSNAKQIIVQKVADRRTNCMTTIVIRQNLAEV